MSACVIDICACDRQDRAITCSSLSDLPENYKNDFFTSLTLTKECVTKEMAKKLFTAVSEVFCPKDDPNIGVAAGSLVGYGLLGALLLIVALVVLCVGVAWAWAKWRPHSWSVRPGTQQPEADIELGGERGEEEGKEEGKGEEGKEEADQDEGEQEEAEGEDQNDSDIPIPMEVD